MKNPVLSCLSRNGPEFEKMTKSKQENNPKFGFLWGGPYFNYYTYKVTTEQTVMRHKQNQGGGGGPRPLMDLDLSGSRSFSPGFGGNGSSGGGNGWGAPEPPVTSHVTDQISKLQNSQATLREQIKQSEQNLEAQYTVLQQNNEILAQEAILKAQENDLEALSRITNVSLSIFDSVLDPIVSSCTKDSISSGKSWIFQNSNSADCNRLLANYLNFRVTSPLADFTSKLHIIYLVNDVLHHCVRKNNHELKNAFIKVALSMYSAAACIATEEQMPKLAKLVTLWETKSKFFDEKIIDRMKDYRESYHQYQVELKRCYMVEVSAAQEAGMKTYDGYKSQHEQFCAHAEAQIRQQSMELEGQQAALRNIETTHQLKVQEWQQQQNTGGGGGGGGVGGGGGGGGNRRSRWDKTAPVGMNLSFFFGSIAYTHLCANFSCTENLSLFGGLMLTEKCLYVQF